MRSESSQNLKSGRCIVDVMVRERYLKRWPLNVMMGSSRIEGMVYAVHCPHRIFAAPPRLRFFRLHFELSIRNAAPSSHVASKEEHLKPDKSDDELKDPYPELPVERGPHGRGVCRWVPDEKHFYLARYLNATREAQKKFKQRVLIDPFCGPGRIQVEGETHTRDGGSVAV